MQPLVIFFTLLIFTEYAGSQNTATENTDLFKGLFARAG